MAIVTTDNRHYSNIANAIRTKSGGSALYLPEEMSDAILAIPSGGVSAEDDIISRTISGSYTNNRVTDIGVNAFYDCSNLTSVDFPNATTIGVSAFQDCNGLTSAIFPNATTIGAYAFRYCSNLTSVDFPNATTIGTYAFNDCLGLTSVTFPNATTTGNNAFRGCSNLTSVDFPNATTIGAYAFNDCLGLTSVDFPNATTIGSYAFLNSGLNALILRNDTSVVKLTATSAFTSTPIADGTGYVYVPDDMVDDYKQATNWVTYANQIKGISELGV